MSIPTSDPPRHRIKRDGARQWLDTLSVVAAIAAVVLIFVTAFQSATEGAAPARGTVAVVANPTLTGAETAGAPTHAATPTAVEFPSATPVPVTPSPELPTATPAPSSTPEPTATPTPPLVAVIVGHRNNDSGAVCEGGDYAGLQEAQVTARVAEELVPRLEAAGYAVTTLDEFDQQIYGLQASALISIHVDSCVNFEGTSGYKVARSQVSAIPEIEDRFVQCMEEEYARVTGLEIHAGSITHNMTSYHAFAKVDLKTPAVIIEVGFLFHDHDLLVEQPERVAVGLRNGIDCFLQG